MSVLNSNKIQNFSNPSFDYRLSDVQVNGSMHADSISVDHLKIPDGGPYITTYNNGHCQSMTPP